MELNKVIIFFMFVIALIVIAVVNQPQEIISNDNRFVLEDTDMLSGYLQAQIIKDIKTGKRYLMVQYGNGTGLTLLEE